MARVLLIDDDEFFRSMVSAVLRSTGHEVVEAADGPQGLDRHRVGGFNLVITDLIMPEKEGIETIVELCRREPSLPIIAMSGSGRFSPQGYLDVAAKVGARLVLAKPFSTSELLAVVDRLLADEGIKPVAASIQGDA